MLTELLILMGLVVLNGVFAMSELAIVSARPARLRAMAAKSKGAALALKLGENPGQFLSTVQIGITAVGVLSGALAGDTLGTRIAGGLIEMGLSPKLASTLGVGGAVVFVTYISLIIGELVPKQIALKNPEAVAQRMAPMMTLLSVAAAPIVWFLDISGKAVLRLLGADKSEESKMTEEEVNVLLTEAQEGGVLEEGERAMISGVMRLWDRNARALMSPRQELVTMPLATPSDEIAARMIEIGRARIPVTDTEGHVVGIVRVTEAFAALARGEALDMARLLVEIPVITEQMEALALLDVLQNAPDHMALVYDEYGSFEGLVSTNEILAAILGAKVAYAGEDEPAYFERDDGSLLIAGWMPADEFCDALSLPRDEAGGYDTAAGIVLYHLGRMPSLGDKVVIAAQAGGGITVEVVDLDGLRIDKLLVTRQAA